MSFKTILLHVNDERRVAGLVSVAAAIAERNEAHLIGLYAMPPVPTYGATAFGAGLIRTGLTAFSDEAKRVHAAFEEACRGRAMVAEWRLVESDRRDVASSVLEHARTVDLVIAGQRDPSFDFSAILDIPDRLVMESGRPVLVVPHSGRFGAVGGRVTVAWNGRRESARALFDAMPLLKAASRVKVVWVNPQSEEEATGDLPTAEIGATLARHGVKCEVASSYAPDIRVGDAILSDLADDGTDLLVMGAYGHSRVREFVFGGATKHILDHMTVPVLLSH